MSAAGWPMFKTSGMTPEQMRAALRSSLKLNLLLGATTALTLALFALYVALAAKPSIVAMSPDGRIVALVTLDQPFVNSRTLAKHAADTLSECLSFSAYDYVRVMQERCRMYFEPAAFADFRAKLESSVFMKETIADRLTTSVRVEAPVVTDQRVVGGVYTWTVEAPLRITQSAGKSERYLNWLATLTLARASNIDVPSGIWTKSVLLEPRGAN